MQLSSTTKTYIDAVRQFSGNQLKRADDCALLMESAALQSQDAVFAELCFISKFLHKTFGLMMRIGSLGDGYDTLSLEFESNIDKARSLMTELAGSMPEEDGHRFTLGYLSQSAQAFEAMMELVHDLNWIKNYSLDKKAQA